MIRKLFRNARISTPRDSGNPCGGEHQGEVVTIDRGALVCRNGLIEHVGEEKRVLAEISAKDLVEEVDCEQACVIPGFVDPHTHICFAKRREEEFRLRIKGVEYLEILRHGGGILASVRAVRECTEKELFENTRRHVLSALHLGTTTVEIKSGYGLTTDAELKMLRVIDRIGKETPLDVIATFLGAHALPAEDKHDPERYVDRVINEMIPAVRDQGVARFCDIFCEKGVFDTAQSERILRAAKRAGLGIKLHADEVHDLGGAALAASLGACSADHLLAANDNGLKAMAEAGVIAVLLPGTAYSLKKPYARARDMVKLNVPVALASDCNPGSCFSESIPFMLGLAVMQMGLSVEEALVAATLNAAYAVGMEKRVGSLDIGKQADFLLLDGESPAIIAYHAGVSPVKKVYKRGELVVST